MDIKKKKKHLKDIVGTDQKVDEVFNFITSDDIEKIEIEKIRKSEPFKNLRRTLDQLIQLGIPATTLKYDPSLARGFDYYTGIVFEVFDNAPDNNRSMFGGGRYDNLLDMFGTEPVPTVGFGMGDVTMQNFLESHNLLPDYEPTTDLYIATVGTSVIPEATKLAARLREQGINVATNLLDKKLGDQFKHAEKESIPLVLVVGEDELKTGMFKLKEIKTRKEIEVKEEDIAMAVFENE